MRANAAAELALVADHPAPAVTIRGPEAAVNDDFDITVTVSEPVSLGRHMFSRSRGATLTHLAPAGAGERFTATVTIPAADGWVRVGLPAGTVTDAAGNRHPATVEYQVMTDRVAPTATITSPAGAAVDGPFAVTVTFSEAVADFSVADLTVANGTAENGVDAAGTGTTFTARITPRADGEVTVNVGAGVATDGAGNPNPAATAFRTTATLTRPTAIITGPAAPVNTDTVDVTVTLSAAVAGLDAGDLVVTNGAVTAWSETAPGTVYTATLTPAADGVVTITVPANVATTPAHAGNHASAPFAVRVDRVAPVVERMESDPAGRVRAMFTLTITFSEDVSGLELTEIATTNGTASGLRGTRSAAVYTVDIQPTGDGNVTVDLAAGIVADAAGNGNGAGQWTVEADVTGPTATVTSAATAPVTADFTVAVTFSEPVMGFDLADVALRNGVARDWVRHGSDAYEFTVRPVADGEVHVHLPAGTVTDAVGNPNAASNRFRIRANVANRPGAPTALRAVGGQRVVTLRWTAPPDVDVSGYRIEHSATGALGSWDALVADTGTPATMYTHRHLADRQTVFYRVAARNPVGLGAASAVVNATTRGAVIMGRTDTNEDGRMSPADATVLYYAFAQSALLGDGSATTGFASYRRVFLTPHLAPGVPPTDANLRAMLARANQLLDPDRNPGFDVNGDQRIDDADALILYYALALPEVLGDGRLAQPGFAGLRDPIIGPHLAAGVARNDGNIREMLRTARRLLP